MTAIDIEPDDQDRAEIARRAAKCIPRNCVPTNDEALAVRHEVAGEEDRQRDLRELARLELNGPMPIHTRASADLASDAGEHRQQQQERARRTRRCRCSAAACGSCG